MYAQEEDEERLPLKQFSQHAPLQTLTTPVEHYSLGVEPAQTLSTRKRRKKGKGKKKRKGKKRRRGKKKRDKNGVQIVDNVDTSEKSSLQAYHQLQPSEVTSGRHKRRLRKAKRKARKENRKRNG